MKTKTRILVVDDNEELCDALKEFLENEGYIVDCANKGKDAIALSHINIYDIVLVDIKLPDISGTELVSKLAGVSPSMEFIYTTAHSSLDSAIKAVKQERVVSYETKPLDMNHLLSILKQITERKCTEEALRRSEKNLNLIYDTVGDVLFQIGVEHNDCFRFLSINRAGLSATGLTEKQIVGKRIEEVIPEPSHALVLDKYKEAIRENKTVKWEETSSYPAGEKIGEVTVTPAFNADGVCTHLIGSVHDITKRKQMEEELRKSKVFLSKLLDTIPIPVFYKDRNGRYLGVNKAFETFFGATKERLIGKTVFDINPPELAEIYQAKDNELFGSGGIQQYESQVMNAHGVLRDVIFNKAIFTDSQGAVNGLIGGILDITERKEMQEILKKSEERYRKLIKTAQDAIICIDEDGIVNLWNQSAENIFGYSKAEIIGKPIETIIPDEYKKRHQEGLERFINTGKSRIIGKIMEVSGITKEKTLIPLEMSLTTQKIENEKYYFTAIIRDITERKQAEEKLLQSEKLRSLGVMSSGIAHDFNNILAVIQGNAQLLKSNCGDYEELMDEIDIICRAACDGAEIVRRIREFTRIECDFSQFISVDIGNLIRQAVGYSSHRWKSMAQSEGITYIIDTDGIKPVSKVLGNPAEIREVFMNIINNALDAMPEGGSLSFRTWSEDNNVFVSISDNGVGMSEDVKKKIFDPFFTTKGVEGTGLGLSVVYGVVARHGGKINVESRIGKGTTFTFRFPIAREETVCKKVFPEFIHEIEPSNYHILVVDDKQDINNLLSKFLSNEGYNIKCIDRGAEAVKLLKEEVFDLLLCNLGMPEVSGYDVIKTVKRLDKRPKVGLITGYIDKFKSFKNEDIKVDFVAEKPIDLPKLSRLVKETLWAKPQKAINL